MVIPWLALAEALLLLESMSVHRLTGSISRDVYVSELLSFISGLVFLAGEG
jgi:hypothetical protein